MINRVLIASFIALFSTQAAPAVAIHYVDATHCPSGDGTSWATAFCTIQEAVNAATDGDGVFVRKGTYAESVTMRSNVFVFGSFAGTESLPDERDISANPSIIDVSSLAPPVRAVLLESVVSTRLDGFILTGGSAPGGGLYAHNVENTVSLGNLRFENNTAGSDNGGGALLDNAPIVLGNCSFTANTAASGAALAIMNSTGTQLFGMSFERNQATANGGGLYVSDSPDVLLSGASFQSGLAQGRGGAVFSIASTLRIEQATFVANTASLGGGAVSIYSGGTLALSQGLFAYNASSDADATVVELRGDAQIDNCLVARNSGVGLAAYGVTLGLTQCTISGNAFGGLLLRDAATASVNNAIFAFNAGVAIASSGTGLTLGTSLFYKNDGGDVKDGIGNSSPVYTGAAEINGSVAGAIGNADGAPAFANPGALDYHLTGASAAIGLASDAFSTAIDLDGAPRPGEDASPDAGAYEFGDEVPPTVRSITVAGASPTNAATVQFVVQFSEAVRGVGANDFEAVSAGGVGILGATVAGISGENATYFVTVNTGTGDGLLRLDVIDNDSILDFNNNLLGGPGNGNGSFTTGETYTIDRTAPVITLIGESTISVEAGSLYIEPGVTATDELDGDLLPRVTAQGIVDIGELGRYEITFNATDTAGNAAAPVTRAVNVVDTIAPIITLLGQNPVRISFGQEYQEAGAYATDAFDGDVTPSLTVEQPESITGPGSYTFTYHAVDASGNVATAYRVLNLVDDTAPILTILGDTRVEVQLGEAYTDPGATAFDNVDGDLTSQIEFKGNLTTAVPGEYTLTFSVADAAGNRSQGSRVVVVLDRPDFYVTPEIQFISSFARTVVFDIYNRSTASQGWKAEVIEGASWCSIAGPANGSLFYGQLYVTSEDNPTSSRRVAKIQISNDDKFALPIIVQVSQAPTPKGVLGCSGNDGAPGGEPLGDAAVVALLTGALLASTRLRVRQH